MTSHNSFSPHAQVPGARKECTSRLNDSHAKEPGLSNKTVIRLLLAVAAVGIVYNFLVPIIQHY